MTRGDPGPGQLRWSPSDQQIDVAGLRAVDAVVHLAGEPVTTTRWTPQVKRRIVDSRVDGTALIARTLADLDDGPRILVSASAAAYYGDRGGELLTEASAPGDTFLADLCVRWEASAEPAEDAGIRVVHLRIGHAVALRGGALPHLLPLFTLGLGGRIGSGHQFWCWVMLEDVVGIILHALTHDAVSGPLNVTAPEPVTSATFTTVLGAVLRRPTLLPVPNVGARLLYGERADVLLSHSQRAIPEATLASGYSFRYPRLEEGLRAVLA